MAWVNKAGVAASIHASPTSGLTFSLTAAGAFSAGDLIVVGISGSTGSLLQDILTVTDNLGNTYQQLYKQRVSVQLPYVSAAYAALVTYSGTPAISVTFQAVPNGGYCLIVDGFTGVSATSLVDVVTSATGFGFSNVAPSSGTTFATHAADELAVAFYSDIGGATTVAADIANVYIANPAAIVSGTNDNNGILMYKDSGPVGSQLTASMPNAPGQNWAEGVVVLKLSPTPGGGSISMLRDPFGDVALNQRLWTVNGSLAMVQENTALLVTHGPGKSMYNGLTTTSAYDLKGGRLLVEVLDVGDQTIASHEVQFGFWVGTGFSARFYLTCSGGLLQVVTLTASGVKTTLFQATYDPVQHRWWSLRESGGTLIFETAPAFNPASGLGPPADEPHWTQQFSFSNSLGSTVGQPFLASGCFNVESYGSHGTFANLNALAFP